MDNALRTDLMPPEPAALPRPEDVALFGKDPTPGVVAVAAVPESDPRAPARVRVWRREGGVVHAEEAPVYPFLFLTDARAVSGMPPERVRLARLTGENPLRHLAAFRTWADYRQARQRAGEAAYAPGGPTVQYLMQSGRTLFKGMAFDDLHRLQLDLEVYSERGFPHPERAADRIIIASLSDNRGWRLQLDARTLREADLIAALVAAIRERDPDVIEGHNIYAFDLAYLRARAERFGVPLALGRDGSEPRTFAASMRFAERVVDYPAVEIAGRHVIDTYFQVLGYDVTKRNLPGYSLKVAARYFGFAAPERTYVEGAQIAALWRTDPERLLAYADDDVTETASLARHLSGSTFYLTQMLPMSYGVVARTGPAAKIEALFVREYLRRRHALPRPERGTQATGGYTDVFVTGVAGPIVYADVESLYPSIMLNYDVRPRSDALRLFPVLLRRLTDLRLETKAGMKSAATPDARSELDARQSSFKILINAFYGMLGFGQALFNDFAEADRTAQTGQDILRQIIDLIRQDGGTVVEVDTDGVLFVPPAGCRGEDAERAFVRRVGEALPQGIRIGFDGRFQRMLSYKKKNYALLGYDGKLRFKGSSLVSRSTERFGRHFVREATALLLAGDVAGLHDLYLNTRRQIEAHAWESVDDFARTETLKDRIDTYQADVAAGRRARAAAYELALEHARRTGHPPRKGDRVSYYIAGNDPAAPGFAAARLAVDWDPAAPDENTPFYLRRLDELARRFEPFFDGPGFRMVFSVEDMFGFSPAGIRVRGLHEEQAA